MLYRSKTTACYCTLLLSVFDPWWHSLLKTIEFNWKLPQSTFSKSNLSEGQTSCKATAFIVISCLTFVPLDLYNSILQYEISPFHVWTLSENGPEQRRSGDYRWVHRNLPKGKHTNKLTSVVQLCAQQQHSVLHLHSCLNRMKTSWLPCSCLRTLSSFRGSVTLHSASSCKLLGLK